MKYRYLDINTYRRRKHFEYFSHMAYPYVSVTVNISKTIDLAAIRLAHVRD